MNAQDNLIVAVIFLAAGLWYLWGFIGWGEKWRQGYREKASRYEGSGCWRHLMRNHYRRISSGLPVRMYVSGIASLLIGVYFLV